MTKDGSNTIQDEVSKMQESLENRVHKAGNDIKELKKAITASTAEFSERLWELMKELQLAEDEKKRLQERIESEKLQLLDNRNLMVLEILLASLQKFGCSVNLSEDCNKRTLYTFDFGNKNYITIQPENSKLSLVEMSPENSNFEKIRAYLDASQDFMGLLSSFRDKVFELD